MGAQILGCHSPTALAAFSLLDLYVSKLPNGAKEKDAFYFTALPKTPEDPEKQYSTVPIGWNKFDRMVKARFDPSDTVWFAVYYTVKQQSSIRYCDVRFMDFHGTMETTYQDLHKEGIRHAPIISGEKEVILWERKS